MKLKSNYHEVYDYLITQYHDGLFYHRKSDVKSLEQLYDNFFTLYNPEKLHWCDKKLFPQVNQLNHKEIRNKIIDNLYDYKDNYIRIVPSLNPIEIEDNYFIQDDEEEPPRNTTNGWEYHVIEGSLPYDAPFQPF